MLADKRETWNHAMEECYTLGLRLRGLVACFMMYVRTCERLDGCVALVISVPFVYIMHLARAGVLYILHHPYLGPSFIHLQVGL